MSKITESDIIRAKRLRAEGFSWNAIARVLGHDHSGLKSALDPAFRARRLRRHQDSAALLRAERREQGFISKMEPIQTAAHSWHRHLPELIADRDQRLLVRPTLDNMLTGTPAKGRSALDRWQPRGEDEIPRNGRPPNDARRKPWHPLRKGEAREAAE